MAFDSSGNLYQTDLILGNVYETSPPFTTGSTPSQSLAVGGTPYGVAVGANNVFVSNLGIDRIFEYALPFTSASSLITTLAGKPLSVMPHGADRERHSRGCELRTLSARS